MTFIKSNRVEALAGTIAGRVFPCCPPAQVFAPELALPVRRTHWPTVLARLAALVSIVTSIGAAQTPESPNGDPGLKIRVESNLVLVPLHVSKGGTAVTGLGPEDFELFEDGVRQKIAFVDGPGTQGESTSPRSRVPKEIVFLIDVSISVSRWRLVDDERIRKGVLDALTEDFGVSVYGFGSRLMQYAAPTRDPGKLARAFYDLSLSREGRSLVYESIFRTLFHASERGGNARRRLFVFSDGMDTTDFEPSRVVQAARELGIAVNPVVVGRPDLIQPNAAPQGIDQSISERKAALRATGDAAHTGWFHSFGQRTGGRKYSIDLMDWRSLSRITKSVSELARTEYLVGYYPRSVDEELTTHEAKIRLHDKRIGKLRGGTRLVSH